MEKRFFWIKLRTDFFDGDAIDWLHEQENGSEYIYIYLRLCLLAANKGGVLAWQVGNLLVPYDVSKIAEVVHSKVDSVVVAVSLFKKLGLVEELEDRTLKITGFETMVGSESASAERVRKHRALARAKALPPSGCYNVTLEEPLHCNANLLHSNDLLQSNGDLLQSNGDLLQSNGDLLQSNTEIEKEIEIDKDTKYRDKAKRFSFVSAIDSLPVSDDLKEALKAWGEMRKSIKKPLTERALKTAMNKLHSLCGDNEQMMIAVVDQSTFNDWQGFFPLKGTPAQPQTDRRQKIKEAMEKGGGWNAWTNQPMK